MMLLASNLLNPMPQSAITWLVWLESYKILLLLKQVPTQVWLRCLLSNSSFSTSTSWCTSSSKSNTCRRSSCNNRCRWCKVQTVVQLELQVNQAQCLQACRICSQWVVSLLVCQACQECQEWCSQHLVISALRQTTIRQTIAGSSEEPSSSYCSYLNSKSSSPSWLKPTLLTFCHFDCV